jgi:iron(III) transport system substrate-binding protein
VVDGVEPDPLIADWGEIRTDSVNASLYGANNAEAVRLMDRAGWR